MVKVLGRSHEKLTAICLVVMNAIVARRKVLLEKTGMGGNG
nr:hypothetical protein [Salmonella sp.]